MSSYERNKEMVHSMHDLDFDDGEVVEITMVDAKATFKKYETIWIFVKSILYSKYFSVAWILEYQSYIQWWRFSHAQWSCWRYELQEARIQITFCS